MKFIYSILLSISCAALFSSQVAIGKTTTTAGASLEFGVGNKGLILPWVTNSGVVSQHATAGQRGGALILDVADRKVKLSRNSGAWTDLTVHTTELPVTTGNAAIDNSLQTGTVYTEKTEAKSQIGGVFADDTPGILVLADVNKAMIPPLVSNPDAVIRSPAPGMMVYDSVKKLFCVYNGTVWSYWRADN